MHKTRIPALLLALLTLLNAGGFNTPGANAASPRQTRFQSTETLPGVYLGNGIMLTSLQNVVAESTLSDGFGGVPLYAQLWRYDADGVSDYGESVLDAFVCDADISESDTGNCDPFNQTPPDAALLYADRRFDLAVLQVDDTSGGLVLDANPLDAGAVVATESGATFEIESAQTLQIDPANDVIVKYPNSNQPYAFTDVLMATGESAAAVPEGAPLLNSDSEVVGIALGASGDHLFISPTAAWIDDLYAANFQIQSPALTAVLDAAVIPAAAHGAEGIGDQFAPELGNGGIDVLHYDLDLSVAPVTPRLDGTASLDIRVIYPNLASFTLDLRAAMGVLTVRVDGTQVNFEQGERKLRIFPTESQPYGTEIHVEIDYAGDILPVRSPYFPFGLIGVVHNRTRPSFGLITEPDAASIWFPSNDHPSDGATYSFHITTDSRFTAVANGEPVAIDEHSDGTTTYHWEMADPMATYLAMIAVADYALIEEETANSVTLRHYVYANANIQRMTRVFSGTPLAIETLEKYFGAYPFDGYGHVLVPIQGGALETQTMTSMPDGVVGLDEEAVIWDLVVHELAHQWYGNRVRLGTWQDIWLNEGFATYAEWLADESRYGADRALEDLARAEEGIRRGRRETPLAYPEDGEMFSRDSYDKGAWVLHMLRGELGDDVFFALLADYVVTFADQPTTTAAFFQFAERYTGRDLTRFRRQWLEQAGIPRFTLNWMPSENGVTLRLCGQRADQDYALTLPLQWADNVGNTQMVNLTFDTEIRDTQNTALELDFDPVTLTIDPFQAVLGDIAPVRVTTLPNCPF